MPVTLRQAFQTAGAASAHLRRPLPLVSCSAWLGRPFVPPSAVLLTPRPRHTSPAAVPLVNDDGLWKVATILASLCAAALLCCLLLPMDTMRRALSRRATPLRMPTLGRTPTFVLERSSVCSEGQSPGEAALARRDRGDAAAAAAEP